jgi:predicted phosphodiesterase
MGEFTPPTCDYDLVILAGDIHSKARMVDWAKRSFSKPVIAVPGNHDYWGSAIDHAITKMEESSVGSNVTLLHNKTIIIDGVRFVGGTLWTDFSLYGNQPLSALTASGRMRDFQKIRGPRFSRFTTKIWLAEHFKTKSFIHNVLETPFDGKTVVVTHHTPCELSIEDRYKGDALSPSYASNLAEMAMMSDVWIHGHVHSSNDYLLNTTRVISNPRGYVGVELNPNFNAAYVIEI